MYEIAYDRPIPEKGSRYKHVYPFPSMKVGASFLIPCDLDNLRRLRTKVINAAGDYKKRNGGNFRTSYSETEKGIIVWRIE